MKKLLTTLSLIITLCAVGFSQGQFDVRFNLNALDCDGEQMLLDIDVRASHANTTFAIAEQNYRFSFNRAALIPNGVSVSDEGTLSSFILNNGVLTALYSPHNLEGSLDTIVSYNVELAGGDGVPASIDWVNVGTLAFAVEDIDECLNLKWHDRSLFPPTFVSTFVGGDRLPVNQGEFLNELTFSCFNDICGQALPVELTSFDAVNTEDCAIELTWKTATETNNAYFKIEKSIDGISYETIGTIEGKGNSNTQSVYTFTDRSPSLDNYYRLTQVDLSGAATLGSQLIIKSTCFDDGAVNTIEVFPNPVRQTGSVKFYNTNLGDTEVELNISDALGRNIQTEILPVIEGANIIHFDTNKLIPGAYFVQLKGNNWLSASQKIVKID